MADAYFTIVTESEARATYRAAPQTGGPWAADQQHGGPPNALLVRAAERLAAVETGRSDLIAMRLSAEFVGPVPVGEVKTRTRMVRAARSAVLVETVLSADGRDCVSARIWLVANRDTAAIAPPVGPPSEPPEGLSGLAASFPYADSVDWRAVHGNIDRPGPSVFWARPRIELIDGEPLSGLQRAALLGDSVSGISAALDWARWSFLNIDLDVHLARPVVGEWLQLDAATELGPNGCGLARGTITDGHGPVGATAQTLVLAERKH
jgi:hypothetical protein